jgi:hypothetical protein
MQKKKELSLQVSIYIARLARIRDVIQLSYNLLIISAFKFIIIDFVAVKFPDVTSRSRGVGWERRATHGGEECR